MTTIHFQHYIYISSRKKWLCFVLWWGGVPDQFWALAGTLCNDSVLERGHYVSDIEREIETEREREREREVTVLWRAAETERMKSDEDVTTCHHSTISAVNSHLDQTIAVHVDACQSQTTSHASFMITLLQICC